MTQRQRRARILSLVQGLVYTQAQARQAVARENDVWWWLDRLMAVAGPLLPPVDPQFRQGGRIRCFAADLRASGGTDDYALRALLGALYGEGLLADRWEGVPDALPILPGCGADRRNLAGCRCGRPTHPRPTPAGKES